MAETANSTTGTVSGLLTPPLNSVASGLRYSLTNLSSTILNKFDQYFPPEKRNAWKDWLQKFATEKPYLAAFLLSNIALSGPPLALFVIMTITVVIFSFIAGLLVGLLGAVLFIVFAVGVALIFILPVLFFTTAAAVFIWLWGIGTYYIIKWFNEKQIPGVHTDLAGGLSKASGLSDLPGVNGEAPADGASDTHGDSDDKHNGKKDEKSNEKPPEKAKRSNHAEEHAEGKSTGAQHRSDGKENSSAAHPRKIAHKSVEKDGEDGATENGNGHAIGARKKVEA